MIRSLFRRSPRLEEEILSWLEDVWDLESLDTSRHPVQGWQVLDDPEVPRRPALVESLRRLRERWSEAELGSMMADRYFNLMEWLQPYDVRDRRRWALYTIVTAAASSSGR